MNIILNPINDELKKEAEKAIQRNEQTKKLSIDKWAQQLAYSQVEAEENIPEKDRTRAIKRIII